MNNDAVNWETFRGSIKPLNESAARKIMAMNDQELIAYLMRYQTLLKLGERSSRNSEPAFNASLNIYERGYLDALSAEEMNAVQQYETDLYMVAEIEGDKRAILNSTITSGQDRGHSFLQILSRLGSPSGVLQYVAKKRFGSDFIPFFNEHKTNPMYKEYIPLKLRGREEELLKVVEKEIREHNEKQRKINEANLKVIDAQNKEAARRQRLGFIGRVRENLFGRKK